MKVLLDRVVIEVEKAPAENVSASGIYIPKGSEKETNKIGIVTAVGDKVSHVKEGDKVMLTPYGYDEITLEGIDYIITKVDNILFVYDTPAKA